MTHLGNVYIKLLLISGVNREREDCISLIHKGLQKLGGFRIICQYRKKLGIASTQQEQPHSIYYNPQLTTILVRVHRFQKAVEANLSKEKFIGKIFAGSQTQWEPEEPCLEVDMNQDIL